MAVTAGPPPIGGVDRANRVALLDLSRQVSAADLTLEGLQAAVDNLEGNTFGDWVAFTPDIGYGTGGVTPYSATNMTRAGRYRIDGRFCDVEVNWAYSGAPSAGFMYLTLPIPGDPLNTPSVLAQPIGDWYGLDLGVSYYSGPCFYFAYSGVSTVGFNYLNSSAQLLGKTNLLPYAPGSGDGGIVRVRYAVAPTVIVGGSSLSSFSFDGGSASTSGLVSFDGGGA